MLPFCNLQKGTIFFRTTKFLSSDLWNFPKFIWHGFCETANVMRKSEVEVKTKTKMERHLLVSYLLASRKKIESSNTKDRIKWVICGATVLFWLHLDSQSFRIVWKFYLSADPWCKQTIKLLVNYLTSGSFLLFINNYC